KGYVPKTRLLKLKREIARLEGMIGEKTSQVSQAKIKVLESEVEAAQAKTDFRKDVISELHVVQGKMFNLEEQILAAKDTLKRLEIKAPRDGVVLDLQFHALNTVIMAGAPVLDIVPNGGALIVHVKIRPTDVDNVLVGAQAEVRFPSFRQRTTPSIFGIVQTVSADTLIDPASSAPYYTARILITEEQRHRIGNRSIVSGMPADVTVRSEDRTLIEYMVEPLADVLARSFKE
ncbi:MAG: HlyD family efflux transporter periplasmic adaptor subunit, partial [Phycisphaeraceae bacterium]|nr:HlyD family efflux transporter periplasmic adaptor subunit [Phycisphaeraceae bacterium]